MADRNIAVFGLLATPTTVETTVSDLIGAGFRPSDISVLYPKNVGTRELAHEANTKAPEGATIGATTGATVGGVVGWLAGAGLLTIPGLGPFLAAGPIVTALAGMGAAGATGGLIGALAGLGVPEYEAKRYEGRLRRGGILISVHSDDSEWARRAKELLERHGADEVSSTAEATADYQP